MKCPHCHSDTKHMVLETRAFDTEIFRRRRCDVCMRTFVTTESFAGDVKIPVPPKREKPKPDTDKGITNDGSHLQDLWR